jgi:hypothetical protein
VYVNAADSRLIESSSFLRDSSERVPSTGVSRSRKGHRLYSLTIGLEVLTRLETTHSRTVPIDEDFEPRTFKSRRSLSLTGSVDETVDTEE